MLIRNFKKWLGERLFPVFCLGCGEEGGWLCRACLSRPVMLANPLYEKVPYVEGVFSVFAYREELIAKFIKKLKYDGASDVMEVFDFYLEKFLAGRSLPVGVIVPVPLHRQRLVQRGFNQSELIARSLARLSGLTFEDKLKRVKKTLPQVGLSGEVRPVKDMERRVREAQKLGFKYALVPESAKLESNPSIINVRSVNDVLDFIK
jgi:predicted amidophosphoribosyltransferase